MADVDTTQDRPDYSEATPPPENGATEENAAPEEQPPNLDELWSSILTLDKTGDFDDLKDSIYEYFRWAKHETFYTINAKFSEANAKTHLVAEERVLPPSKELVDLQGNGNRKFIVEIVRNPRALKLKLKTDEQFTENDRRLKEEAGIIRERERKDGKYELEEWQMNRLSDKQKWLAKNACLLCGAEDHRSRECPTKEESNTETACFKCGETGHHFRACPNPTANDRGPMVCRRCNEEGHKASDCPIPETCRRCNEEGHHVRDCPQPETCRRCGQEGHRVAECEQPDTRFTCRRCGETGHKASDCTQPDTRTCRRCNEPGHMASECSQPDTRFNCRNCNEPGHKAAECDKPRKERDPNACRRCGSLEHRVHDCPEPDRRVCNLCGERGHVSHACPNPNGAPADTQDTTAPDGGNDDSYGASYDKSAFNNMWNSSEPEANTASGW